MNPAFLDHEGSETCVSSLVPVNIAFHGTELPVPGCPPARLDFDRVPLCLGKKRLLPVQNQTHRTSRGLCQQGDVNLHRHIILSSEGAPCRGPDDPDPVFLHPENNGDLAAVAERPLVGRPDHQVSLPIHHSHSGLGLKIGMIHDMGPVGILYDHVGLGKPLFDIPFPRLAVEEDVSFLVNLRSSLGKSLPYRRDHGQRTISDTNGLDRILGNLLGFGGNERNRVPGVTHMLPDKGLLVLEGNAVTIDPRDVLRGQDAGHPLHGEGFPRVDLFDQRMGNAGAKDPAVKHIRERNVL